MASLLCGSCHVSSNHEYMGLPCSQPHCPVHLLSPPPPSSTKMAQQQIRQNYHEECEALVNKQINMELYASYVYVAIANYFNRVDQSLPGFACFFKKSSCAVHHHGVTLMEYQAKRGGKVVLQDISQPARMEWGTPVDAMTAALELEKMVTKTLQDLQVLAADKKDFHLCDIIQKEFVDKKVNIIKEIGDCLTKIKRVGDGAGVFVVDREIEKAVVTQTLVDLQAVVSSVKHCHVNTSQVAAVREIADCLATFTF